MATNTKECSSRAGETAREPIITLLDRFTREGGSTVESKALGSAPGLMAKSTRVNGWITRNMAKEYTHGPMAEVMRATIETIRNTVTGHTLGLTGESTSDNGRTTKDMEGAHM